MDTSFHSLRHTAVSLLKDAGRGVAFCLLDQLNGSRVAIDPAMPSELGEILDKLSGGNLDGFGKRDIFVRQDSIQV
jgi:hypothetical protein